MLEFNTQYLEHVVVQRILDLVVNVKLHTLNVSAKIFFFAAETFVDQSFSKNYILKCA